MAFFSVMFFSYRIHCNCQNMAIMWEETEKCPPCPTDLLLPSLATLGVKESICRRSQTPVFCEGESWNGLYEFCMNNDCRFDLKNCAELQNKINASISYQLTPKFSVECWTLYESVYLTLCLSLFLWSTEGYSRLSEWSRERNKWRLKTLSE